MAYRRKSFSRRGYRPSRSRGRGRGRRSGSFGGRARRRSNPRTYRSIGFRM